MQEEKSPAIIRAHRKSEGRARRLYVNGRRVTRKQKQRELDETIFNPPTRARTLAARYPVRELDGCCRTILLLHSELAVCDEADKAGEQCSPFKRMDDLNEAIKSLSPTYGELEADYRKVIPIWAPFLPSTKNRFQAQYEKKMYAPQLHDDLTYTKSKLEKQDLRFLKLEQGLQLCLSDDSVQALNSDGTKLCNSMMTSCSGRH